MTFQLDQRLENDTVAIGETRHYLVRLANDKRFPWVILVPRFAAIKEVYQLAPEVQQQLTVDSSVLGQELMDLFEGDSLNTGALGNVVQQLHIHHVVRFESDPAWPGPVWGFEQPLAYPENELQVRVKQLQHSLSILSA